MRMNRLEINLANDLIMPARKRRLIYRALLVYLLLAGGVLAVTCGKASSDIREALVSRHRAGIIQQQFQRLHPGERSMLQYADRLQAQVNDCTQQARTLREALPASIHSALPILTVLVNQTDGSTLRKLTFIQESGKRPLLEFSIAVPVQGRKSPASVLLQNWQKNPELTKQFAVITPTTALRGEPKDEDMLIMNYRATFKE
jgi:hypothetical protein